MLVDYVHSLYRLKFRLIFCSLFQNIGFHYPREKKREGGSNGEKFLALQCGKLKKQSITEIKFYLVAKEDCRQNSTSTALSIAGSSRVVALERSRTLALSRGSGRLKEAYLSWGSFMPPHFQDWTCKILSVSTLGKLSAAQLFNCPARASDQKLLIKNKFLQNTIKFLHQWTSKAHLVLNFFK